MHARSHARDYDRLIQHSEPLITWAAMTLMTANHPQEQPAGIPRSRAGLIALQDTATALARTGPSGES